MFFDSKQLAPRKSAILHELPPVPDTGWKPPTEFPNLSGAVILGIDTETKENDFDHGPGWARGQSHIVGASVAAQARNGERGKWYFPIRHEIEGHDNLDVVNTLGWLKSVLETPVPKVGANLLYDVGTFAAEGITVQGPMDDVQFGEALLDERALVALDELGLKYLNQPKTSEILYPWLRQAYPQTSERKRRADIYRAPPRLVGPYAEDDADLPLRILPIQLAEMDAQGLNTVYRMECDLIPLLVEMRMEGVTVDLAQALDLHDRMQDELRVLYARVTSEYGYTISSCDSRQLGPLFKHVGIPTLMTDAGNPSVTKEWLATLTHPLGDIVRDIREREKLCGTFIQSYIVGNSIPVAGSNSLAKIHPQFHPLKGDTNGTKVGRFAASDPNFQNIPSRTELGKAVRSTFVMDQGHHHWKKMDQSQIHYRILAHNAVGPGSDDLRNRYINDKTTDYHQDVLEAVAPLMGWDTSDKEHNKFVRRPIKNVNFGLLYGQSIKALAAKVAEYFGASFTDEQVKGFFAAYFEGAPYVKPTMKAIGEEVQLYGFVTSILGRRCRFDEWESGIYGTGGMPLPYDEAIAAYGSNIKRAYEYRGVNYKFQSSEPDILKMGMVNCYKSGVFKYTGVPRITVHDELDFSVRDDSPKMIEAFDFIQHTLENSVKLRVPLFVDMDRGMNWGEVG